MLGRRMDQANKISERRWKQFHSSPFSFYGGFKPLDFRLPPVGAYRKIKGCECRSCSARKQDLKKQTNARLRLFKGSIPDGGAYKRLDDPWNYD